MQPNLNHITRPFLPPQVLGQQEWPSTHPAVQGRKLQVTVLSQFMPHLLPESLTTYIKQAQCNPGRCGSADQASAPNQKVARSIPSQATCPGRGPNPWSECTRKATHRWVCLSLSKKTNIFLRKNKQTQPNPPNLSCDPWQQAG